MTFNALPSLSSLSRRSLLATAAALLALPALAQVARWAEIEKKARGQTVYFNAWAGSEQINAYLKWAGSEVERRYGVKLEHVKVTDTVDVVKRVRNEKQAGKTSDGSVDLVWINGENFLTMKREAMLFGPFAESLPSFKYVDTVGKPTTRIDFSEPVDGLEAPWGMAQLTFFADSQKVANPPQSMAALQDYARANPGRITYPKPPNFHGTTFLKQALVELSTDRKALYQPVSPQSLAAATEPLWRYLDALHPHLWRNGKQFPANSAAQRQMMADGELHLAITFNPNEAANEIAASRLAKSVKSYQFSSGTIGNTHFLAIPFNAKAKEGAQVLANFLLSPEAQARKADISQWGDPTVLAMDKLDTKQRALFSAGKVPGLVEKPAPVLPEPHASWVDAIEKEWQRRYAQQ